MRALFCRTYCKAAFIPLPSKLFKGDYFRALAALEGPFQAIAPADMRLWEKRNFREMDEPTELLDRLLHEIRAGPGAREALDRQAAMYREHKDGTSKRSKPKSAPEDTRETPAPTEPPRTALSDAQVSATCDPKADWFVMRPRKAQAYGRPVNGGFLVRAGSTAVADGPLENRDRGYRDELLRKGVLVKDRDPTCCGFRKTTSFRVRAGQGAWSSPGTAAARASGCMSARGRVSGR